MKIAILVPDITNLGGVEQVSITLAKRLTTEGNIVAVVSLKSLHEQRYFDISVVKIEYLEGDSEEKLSEFFKAQKYDKVIVQLSTAFKNLCPLADWKLLRLIALYSKIELVIHGSPKYFVTRYNTNADGKTRFFLKRLYTKFHYNPQIHSFFRHAKKYVSQFITLSKGCQKELRQYHQLDSVVRYNPYDFLKADIHTGQKKNIVVFAGRLSAEKNLVFLLRSWKKIQRKQDWILQIVGNGSESEKLRSLIQNERIEAVSLVPAVPHDELLERFSESKICVLASFFEAFPTVICEAMNMKNTVVSTRYDGFSDELLENNETGFVVDFSEQRFAEKLQFLIENPSELQKMQEKAYARCKQFYESGNENVRL
ncbi:MAG: glycosyltransferase [Treponema sp.]|nr:glycosyltransferase [Treponema sp.]